VCPKPWDDTAPEGGNDAFKASLSGMLMLTWLFTFLFKRVREAFLERAGELVRMPPGEGRPEIWDMDVDVCSSDVDGSK
jgi:hypothetical protein